MKKKSKNKRFANFVKTLLLSSILFGGGGAKYACRISTGW